MKKITLPLVLAVLTIANFSCSNESSNEVPPSTSSAIAYKSLNTTDVETAKRLYADMIASEDYINWKSSIREFNDKILVPISFKSKTEWMNWLSTNLSSTTFTNAAEFEISYDNLIGKLETIMAANEDLYLLLEDATISQLQQIIPSIHLIAPEYPSAPFDCLDDCLTEFDNGVFAAEQAHLEAFNDALFSDGPFEELLCVEQELEYALWETLPLAFNACAGNC